MTKQGEVGSEGGGPEWVGSSGNKARWWVRGGRRTTPPLCAAGQVSVHWTRATSGPHLQGPLSHLALTLNQLTNVRVLQKTEDQTNGIKTHIYLKLNQHEKFKIHHFLHLEAPKNPLTHTACIFFIFCLYIFVSYHGLY